MSHFYGVGGVHISGAIAAPSCDPLDTPSPQTFPQPASAQSPDPNWGIALLTPSVVGSRGRVTVRHASVADAFVRLDIKVLRFWNNEVIENMESVLEVIRATLTPSPLVKGGGA